MYNYLNNRGHLYVSQNGFRSSHSTNNAINKLLGEIIKNTENSKYTVTLFLDLSKAFNTVEHDVVYEKMEKYGLRGNCLDWFKSYLSNREMHLKGRVAGKSGETRSENFKVTYDNPQGSCLEPLIFLIFCNDVQQHLEHIQCIQFADDTNLHLGNKSLKYLESYHRGFENPT